MKVCVCVFSFFLLLLLQFGLEFTTRREEILHSEVQLEVQLFSQFFFISSAVRVKEYSR